MSDEPRMSEGDVITVTGYSVPVELEGKYFKVEAILDDGTVQLGMPFDDAQLTRPSGWEYMGTWLRRDV